jgi:protease PrsW
MPPTPHSPYVLPRDPKHRVLTRGAVVCGLLSLGIIASNLGAAAFALGVLIAVIPVPLYVVMALWLDRFEPEPARTLAQTFAWGASVAVFIALLGNGLAGQFLEVTWGTSAADFLGSVVLAPVVEELAKGAALLFLFSELRDEFDGVVDGVVYAAMVGLGFAMIENVQYYGEAVAAGMETSVLTFVLRGMMAPFAHPLFTAMFGIGLGLVREGPRDGRRWLAAAGGLCLAVAVHSLWNLAATFEGWFLGLYLVVMVPAFTGVLWLILVSLRREGRLIREHLTHLVEDGLLSPGELDCLCRVRNRLRASYAAWREGGVQRWRRRREMHRVASELAFHRWRVTRGLSQGPIRDAAREYEYQDRLVQLCRLLEV